MPVLRDTNPVLNPDRSKIFRIRAEIHVIIGTVCYRYRRYLPVRHGTFSTVPTVPTYLLYIPCVTSGEYGICSGGYGSGSFLCTIISLTKNMEEVLNLKLKVLSMSTQEVTKNEVGTYVK